MALGRRPHQHFVNVPPARFIAMLTYQAALVGIPVLVTAESYTSQASFLDGDPLPVSDPTAPAPPLRWSESEAREAPTLSRGRRGTPQCGCQWFLHHHLHRSS
jgi:hypothetical protein